MRKGKGLAGAWPGRAHCSGGTIRFSAKANGQREQSSPGEKTERESERGKREREGPKGNGKTMARAEEKHHLIGVAAKTTLKQQSIIVTITITITIGKIVTYRPISIRPIGEICIGNCIGNQRHSNLGKVSRIKWRKILCQCTAMDQSNE